ncbi:hypothetical protein GCM10011324_06730 [Allosediminivita pacifica]|nr:hypothetical protein GCM10011324_06730 [Allosediminivita pacifica]
MPRLFTARVGDCAAAGGEGEMRRLVACMKPGHPTDHGVRPFVRSPKLVPFRFATIRQLRLTNIRPKVSQCLMIVSAPGGGGMYAGIGTVERAGIELAEVTHLPAEMTD